MEDAFRGFPAAGFQFFKQLASHNNRDWFQAHKDVYEQQCRAPMQALAEELEQRFGAFKISRINRDLRFSRNREPFYSRSEGAIIHLLKHLGKDRSDRLPEVHQWIRTVLEITEPQISVWVRDNKPK